MGPINCDYMLLDLIFKLSQMFKFYFKEKLDVLQYTIFKEGKWHLWKLLQQYKVNKGLSDQEWWTNIVLET